MRLCSSSLGLPASVRKTVPAKRPRGCGLTNEALNDFRSKFLHPFGGANTPSNQSVSSSPTCGGGLRCFRCAGRSPRMTPIPNST
jgi:hypothetical protein